jgi:hypothetical protein
MGLVATVANAIVLGRTAMAELDMTWRWYVESTTVTVEVLVL